MSVREGQTRIRNIAKTLSDDEKLSDLDKEFLINALQNIANGNDAEKELGVKAKKGERKSRQKQNGQTFLQNKVSSASGMIFAKRKEETLRLKRIKMPI